MALVALRSRSAFVPRSNGAVHVSLNVAALWGGHSYQEVPMVAPNKRRPVKFAAPWHSGFLAMLPTIRSYAQGAFAHLNPDLRQDLTQEVIANCLVAYVRLFRQGRVALAFPTVLAKYAVAQVNDGRKVGNRLNINEVLSPYAQKRRGITVERLDHFDEEENAWREAVVQDTRSTPVPEIAAAAADTV
jgi:hypothetical protein